MNYGKQITNQRKIQQRKPKTKNNVHFIRLGSEKESDGDRL